MDSVFKISLWTCTSVWHVLACVEIKGQLWVFVFLICWFSTMKTQLSGSQVSRNCSYPPSCFSNWVKRCVVKSNFLHEFWGSELRPSCLHQAIFPAKSLVSMQWPLNNGSKYPTIVIINMRSQLPFGYNLQDNLIFSLFFNLYNLTQSYKHYAFFFFMALLGLEPKVLYINYRASSLAHVCLFTVVIIHL